MHPRFRVSAILIFVQTTTCFIPGKIPFTFNATKPWTKLIISWGCGVAPDMDCWPFTSQSNQNWKMNKIVNSRCFSIPWPWFFVRVATIVGWESFVHRIAGCPSLMNGRTCTRILFTFVLPNRMFLKLFCSCSRHSFLLWDQLPHRCSIWSCCNL